jgi:hypothetical protein
MPLGLGALDAFRFFSFVNTNAGEVIVLTTDGRSVGMS